jgi:hypothetical protein
MRARSPYRRQGSSRSHDPEIPMIPLKTLLLALLAATTAHAADTPAPPAAPKLGCTSAESRAFDFWIGKWDVTDPTGKTVGHSRIESILSGCSISEHWEGRSGFTGVSYNAWDAKAKAWHQFWVDAQGNVARLQGGIAKGSMVLQSAPSATHVDRITWTPNADASVRQLWESSEDGGKAWKTVFDGLYRKAQ